MVGRPLLFRSLVIVGSFDRKLYAIEASSGVKRWSVSGGNWFWAGPVSDGTTIFAGSMDGHVYGIDPNSLNPGAPDPLGNVLWKHNMGSPIVSRPALVSRGLVVAAKDGKVSLLDTDVAVATDRRGDRFHQRPGGRRGHRSTVRRWRLCFRRVPGQHRHPDRDRRESGGPGVHSDPLVPRHQKTAMSNAKRPGSRSFWKPFR